MPAAFDSCVKRGGRVVTKELPEGHYIHGCTPDGGKTWHWGHRKKKISERIKRGK